MNKLEFHYKDASGWTSATAEASFADEQKAIESARINLSERDYAEVQIWSGARLVARLHRHELERAA